MTTEDVPERLPLLAVYNVNISFRGTLGTKAPTLPEIEEAIENVLVDLGGDGAIAVRASATRTDG